MYFFTQSGKKDASSFAQVATFFVDKFPAAFGATATYTNSKGSTSDEQYIRIDVANSVEYEFAEGSEEHAESFESYESRVLQSFQKNSEAESAVFLLELLLEQSANILKLPVSIRTAECTIQRFYLLLWPLLNLAESGEYSKAKELTVRFIDLLVEQSAFSLKIKVDSLVQLYNSVHTNSGIKSFAFEKLIDLCSRENCCEIVVERARKIVQESASWTLSNDERKSLYQTVGRALDKIGESGAAFKVFFSALKLYEESDASIALIEEDARRCVILAIKAVDVINFAELLELPAIKQLTSKHAKVFELLNQFSESTAQEFKSNLTGFRDLMTKEGLTEQELVVKKSYVQICTLDTQVTNFTFTDLSQLLNVSPPNIYFLVLITLIFVLDRYGRD